MKKTISKRNEIVKFGKYNLSLNEQRLIIFSLSQINSKELEEIKGETQEEYEIREKNYFKEVSLRKYRISINDIDKKFIKMNRQKLSQFQYEIMKKPLMLPNKKGEYKITVNWFSDIEYIPETMEFEIGFSSKLIPFIFQLKRNFSTYSINEIINFKSSYSIRIYEFINQYRTLKNKNFTINLEEFCEILNLSKSMRATTNLKDKVLNKAQQELREHSNLTFTYELLKDGRKYTKIKFTYGYNYELLNNRDYETELDKLERDLKEVLYNKEIDITSESSSFIIETYINKKYLEEKFLIHNEVYILKDYFKKGNDFILKLVLNSDKNRTFEHNINKSYFYELYYFLQSNYTELEESDENLFDTEKCRF